MKKRSITHRNLLGGLLGGVLGLLLFNLVHPYMTPAGVLLGVVTGYWYQEIWFMIVAQWNHTVQKYQNVVAAWKGKRAIKAQGHSTKTLFKRAFLKKWIPVARLFFRLKIRLNNLAVPSRKKLHPATYAYRIRFFAVLTYLGCNTFVTYLMYLGIGGKNAIFSDTGGAGGLIVLIIFFWLIAFMVAVFTFGSLEQEEGVLGKMKSFYLLLEEYTKLGGVKFFFKRLLRAFLFQLSFFGIIATFILYWTVGLVLLASIWVIPIASLVGILRGLYKITIRPNHWLCVVVTLTVTLTIGFVTMQYITNIYTLWFTALLAGVISGVLTEGARKLIKYLFKHNEKVVEFAFVNLKLRFEPKLTVLNSSSDKIVFGIRKLLLGY